MPTPTLPRTLDLASLLANKSHFLLGPRQTGKTTLIRDTLPGVRSYDLLDSRVFLDLSRSPQRLAEEVDATTKIVAIDEIQRLPELLNEVHRLIESRGIHFLLTGSSARALRRGGVNLLGGRARTKYLHPLTRSELGAHFDLARAIERGTIPSIYFSDDPAADLDAYAGIYLQQEVIAEGATRNAQAFSRFLRVAALCNGHIVNFTKIANDAQVPRTTVYEYFEILKDTLIIHELPAWQQSTRRKPIMSSKYYFFDVGVASQLQGRPIKRETPEFGGGFEAYVMHELKAYVDYRSADDLRYWRSLSGFEVDFILGDHTAIEIKATRTVTADHLKGLRALAEEQRFQRYLCVAMVDRPRTVDGITVIPWRHFLDALWAGEYR
ncbi:MAG: ATP-binding protein [Gemmatimonadaceae bacterium]|nr:ATP-binding protein [Gemmatimonadaceae bacterium]